MRRILLSLAISLGLLAPAMAQINITPQFGVTTGYYAKITYSSAFFGLVPPASATDELCITGSATKVIRVARITLGGTATAAINFPVTVLRRVIADTGGTAATTTANPGVTTQIASRDSGQALNTAATAVLISYTAVPTITDAAPVYLDSNTFSLATPGTIISNGNLVFDWSRDIENNVQVPTLRGAAQQLCVNFNANSVGAGAAVNGQITWTEE